MRNYKKPLIRFQAFTPQEYVSSCEPVVGKESICTVGMGYAYDDANHSGHWDTNHSYLQADWEDVVGDVTKSQAIESGYNFPDHSDHGSIEVGYVLGKYTWHEADRAQDWSIPDESVWVWTDTTGNYHYTNAS
jgi:hypothetical protein